MTPLVNKLKSEGAYRILAASQKLEAQGHSVVHFEIGQPDFATPGHVAEAGVAAIRAGKTTYCGAQGIKDLRQAIADFTCQSRELLKGAYKADNVVVGPGAKPGMWFAMQALIRPGDKVLCPDPGFPSYTNAVNVFGGELVTYNALQEGVIDIEEIERKLQLSNVRLIIINSPSNPIGSVIPASTLTRLAKLLADNPDVWVISDEIYSQLVYGRTIGQRRSVPSLCKHPQLRDRLVLVDGFSKTFSMTGWRLGWILAADPDLIERVTLLVTHAMGCTSPFIQEAGIAALTGNKDEAMMMLTEYHRRRDYVVDRLRRMPLVKCLNPEGAFYAFPDVSGVIAASGGVVRSANELATLLLQEGFVAVLAGTEFGSNGEGHIRISYVCGLDQLKNGLDRMEKVIMRLLENGKAKL